MQIVLYALSALLMLAGLYGLVMGWDIIMVERGWSQFIAGATAFSAGAVILALAHMARQLIGLRRDLTGLVVEVDEPAAPTVASAASVAAAAPARSVTDAAGDTSPASDTSRAAPGDVVGTYASGGVTYFMYADQSIEAELPDGRRRFSSMEELRIYLDTGQGGTVVRKGPPQDVPSI